MAPRLIASRPFSSVTVAKISCQGFDGSETERSGVHETETLATFGAFNQQTVRPSDNVVKRKHLLSALALIVCRPKQHMHSKEGWGLTKGDPYQQNGQTIVKMLA